MITEIGGVATLVTGDCRTIMAALPENYMDSIVCDPPYGLSFMGKGWDHGVPGAEFWVEALRVAKPGAYLLAFGGTRTHHRLMVAIEDAGWEIRDCVMWVYGSGFPKSHNGEWGGTALKPAWEPIILARKPLIGTVAANVQQFGTGGLNIDGCRVDGPGGKTFESPRGGIWATDSEAKAKLVDNPLGRWPANLIHDGSEEVLACFPDSKGQLADVSDTAPSAKTSNVYGAMARVGESSQDDANEGEVGFKMKPGARRLDSGSAARFFKSCELEDIEWLAQNLHPSLALTAARDLSLQNILDCIAQSDAVTSALPEGTRLNGSTEPSTTVTASESKLIATSVMHAMQGFAARCLRAWQQERLSPNNNHVNVVATREQTGIMTITVSHWRSDGSAEPVIFNITPLDLEPGEAVSRFKYCAKASKLDRNEGCEGLPLGTSGMVSNTSGQHITRRDGGAPKPTANNHPTVKPTALMRYLCRLVTPPGGTILDPFMGSGSTGKAALLEGFKFVGIEISPEYMAIAERRITGATIQ